MSKNVEYECASCGARFPKWSGQCPTCKEWNTLSETIKVTKISNKASSNSVTIHTANKNAKKLKDVELVENDRFLTTITEFNRTVGGGLVNDSISILSAPPGAGKSTLCLQIANSYIEKGKTVLYASGEESATQIKRRAERLELSHRDEIYVLDSSSMDDVLKEIDKYKPDFCVIDSIQTYSLGEFLPARAGNPIQVMECATAMVNVAKNNDKPCTVILIGQMTKDDELASVRSLEHLVDAVFKLEGPRDEQIRMLTSDKNRFGGTDETGFFKMTNKGLEGIDNPSEFFMVERETPVSGTSITVLREGSRPVIVEIDALTSKSFSPYPMRVCDSLKKDKMNILISILEQKAGISLFDTNVAISAAGGIKLVDSSCSLAILMAITSSKYNKSIDDNIAFLADVTLTGELRKLPDAERCVKELNRMGFKTVYLATGQKIEQKDLTMKIKYFHTIKDVIKEVF